MPWVRHTSATLRPASPSLTIARICSSVNLLRFIGPPLKAEDPHSTRGGLLGAGQHRHCRTPRGQDFRASVKQTPSVFPFRLRFVEGQRSHYPLGLPMARRPCCTCTATRTTSALIP